MTPTNVYSQIACVFIWNDLGTPDFLLMNDVVLMTGALRIDMEKVIDNMIS